MMNDAGGILLEVRGLRTSFLGDAGEIRALDGVDLTVRRGEVHGVVGESGCGKSVTARSILRILGQKGKIIGGDILFSTRDGGEPVNIALESDQGDALRRIRGNEISMIFQEPMTAFSPVYTIGNQIIEAIQLHQPLDDDGSRELTVRMLKRVGIPHAAQVVDQYPFELSGGMRQRAMIAMALVSRPSLLIADEPTTALDVTIQAQILELMRELQAEFGMSIIIITHDLGVIAEMTDSVSVMYLGKVVEQAPVDEIFHNPQHPYTKCLLESIPKIDRKRSDELATIKGAVPDAYNIPDGCSFHPRCPHAIPGRCNTIPINMTRVSESQTVRCVLFEQTVPIQESVDD